jgi:hypothetical protein
MTDLTLEQKAAIIQQAMAHPAKFPDGVAAAKEILLEAGITPEEIARIEPLLRARQQYRAAMAGLVRRLFPVEPLPDGALPVYDLDPRYKP